MAAHEILAVKLPKQLNSPTEEGWTNLLNHLAANLEISNLIDIASTAFLKKLGDQAAESRNDFKCSYNPSVIGLLHVTQENCPFRWNELTNQLVSYFQQCVYLIHPGLVFSLSIYRSRQYYESKVLYNTEVT